MSRALLGTLLVLSAASSPGPLRAQAVDWKGEMQGDIRHVIDFHYKRHVMDAELRAIMCLAREGAMLPQTSAGSASEIVAYWEVYGLEAGETVEITVALQEEGAGMVTRVLRTLGGQAGAQAPEVSWTEPVSGPTHPMAMTVDAGQLGAGDYELQIEVTGPDGTTATAIRAVQLGER